MIYVFALIIMTAEGTVIPDKKAYFYSVNRCNYFAQKIEQGNLIYSGKYAYRTNKIDAYCLPVMIEQETRFWD